MGSKSDQRYQKRVDAVKAVQRGDTPAVVARVMNIPKNTLYDWLSRYRSGGYHRLKDGAKQGRPGKVTAEIMSWLYEAVTLGDPRQYQFEFCLWTLKIIMKMLKQEHGIELSKSSVSRLLRQLGLSAQRPVYKAYQQDPAKVKEWLNERYPEIQVQMKKHNAKLFFCDEASFRSDSHTGTTWGKKGETPIVEEHRGRYGINCISAISAQGLMRFKCYEGRMNSERFIDFLKSLRKDFSQPVYLVVDGAKYHTSKEVSEYIESTNGEMELFQLPSYSPELNPDEQVWNHAKRRTGKMAITSKTEMKKEAKRDLLSIQNQ